jgi:hypothetical protein
MIVRISVLLFSLALLLGMSGVQAQAASTPSYLGQTSWSVTITQNTSDPGLVGQSFPVTGGITRLGDNYYLFQGYVAPPDDNPFVLSGGGVLLNGQLILTLNTSQNHTDTWRDGGLMQVNVSQDTLNGSLYEIGHDYNTGSGQYDQRFTAATLARTGPMIALTSAPGAATSLLLLE